MLADLSGWQIETDDVTEIKVPTLKVGQGVTIEFDALPDVELKGAGGIDQLRVAGQERRCGLSGEDQGIGKRSTLALGHDGRRDV